MTSRRSRGQTCHASRTYVSASILRGSGSSTGRTTSSQFFRWALRMASDLVATLDRILSLSGEGPRDLERLRTAAETIDEREYSLSQEEVAAALAAEGWGGSLHSLIKRYLAAWDYAP